MDELTWIFAAVCGQNPAHTWAPGGEFMPCCQRCTGLYAGALFAAVSQLWPKPRLTGQFLAIHGLFLLQMVPFGYHWLPQGPVLRTVTGILFGAGLATFLMLAPSSSRRSTRAPGSGRGPAYFIALGMAGGLVLELAESGRPTAASLLTLLVTAGLLTLLGLLVVNAVMYGTGLWRCVRANAQRLSGKRDADYGSLAHPVSKAKPSTGA